ncbi:hypothetical protein H0H81_010192 [Sphagnurus paluster]|uniref:BUB1 N-terminal domain-containing protein n=1 Tax=Sphagnurus paluster TaxID=117069 RepID=A0A9P7K596_9AGAR|nr:hypothetical protein H0H81_010192 [Sphagnurus paluster]
MPGRTPADARRLDDERKRLRAKLDVAINEEDDPLAVYDQFIQWTIQSYGEKDPNSGLRHLLEEATRKFKDDPIYKTDLRYLKLWAMYATLHERPGAIAIYGHLLATGIGTSFSLLYEKYAVLLEADGKLEDADVLYRQGIRLQARPVERLKTRYRDFLSRSGFSSKPTATSKTSIGSSSTASKSQVSQPKTQNRSASSSSSTSKRNPASRIVNFNSTAESRYAAMLTPPDPGKRAEKMRFNMSLLFTKEGGEFSIQEARARSLGLLGKKWGPPPASESYRFPGTSSLSMPVDFNDDGMKQGMGGRRKSYLGGGEPTVTINTREALEDVFGMYNSPDRTVKVQPGSKYAPVRDIQPLTPAIAPRGNSLQNTKTPTAGILSQS